MLFLPKEYSKKIILFFIGAPRCGTTLVGQLINLHPNCYIPTEQRVLDGVIRKGKKLEKLLAKSEKIAKRQFLTGLENDRNYKNALSQFQSKWRGTKSIANEANLRKEEIKVVGDKKAGGTALLFSDFREDFCNLVDSYPNMRFLHIIRNPISSSISYMRSHPHEVSDFSTALTTIMKRHSAAVQASKLWPEKFCHLYYEELLNNPTTAMTKLMNLLNLPLPTAWLKAVEQIVDNTNQFSATDEQKELLKEFLKNFPDLYFIPRYLKSN